MLENISNVLHTFSTVLVPAKEHCIGTFSNRLLRRTTAMPIFLRGQTVEWPCFIFANFEAISYVLGKNLFPVVKRLHHATRRVH